MEKPSPDRVRPWRSLLLITLSLIVCLTAPAWSEPTLPAAASEPVRLMMALDTERVGEFHIEIQSKSDISMLMIPKTTVMTQIIAEGSLTTGPRRPGDPQEAVGRQVFATHVASVAFYPEGQPNQELDEATTREAFLTSGIPPIDQTVTCLSDITGRTIQVEGVTASYTKYFDVTILEFPHDPVAIGGSWMTTRHLPLAYDLNNPPVWCSYVATFTLESVDHEKKTAFIRAVALLADDASGTQTLQPEGVSVHGDTVSQMTIDLETGMLMDAENESHSRIEFGNSANFIAIHQRMRAQQHFKKPITP